MATSPEEGMASMIRNLEQKTGKSLDVWIATARGSGKAKHKEIVTFLKTEHGLTHGYANQIAQRRWPIPMRRQPAATTWSRLNTRGRRPPCGQSTRQSWPLFENSVRTSKSHPRKPT